MTLDLERLLAVTFDAARRAGDAIMEIYAGDFAVGRKADASPVMLADQRAETIILAALAEAAPAIPVIAEEHCEAHGVPSAAAESAMKERRRRFDRTDTRRNAIHNVADVANQRVTGCVRRTVRPHAITTPATANDIWGIQRK